MSQPQVRAAVFWLPKAGSTRAEYEDAVACSVRRRRFAVADGASASAFARLWAQLLVRAYIAGQLTADTLESDLAPAQERWSTLVDQRPLPWYAAEQARRGAFAALVGLSFTGPTSWSALAVGDCCLFHVREDELLGTWPLSDVEEFGNRPLLIGSRPIANMSLRRDGAIVQTHGEWQPGDSFLLVSDALAATFLQCPEAMFDVAPRGGSFRAWVHAMREQRRMRNDDVSLLWLATTADAAA